jgi:type I restriction enzyme S subunit
MRHPNGWEVSRVSELNCFTSRTVDPKSSPTVQYELYSVPTFPTGKPEIPLGAAIGSTKQSVEPGDVLVCKINPRINRVWIVGEKRDLPQIASSEWIGVRVPEFEARFLLYYFSSPAFRELIEEGVSGVGGSLTRAQPKRVGTFPVPVAPRSEQKRIADKLDAVLGSVEVCRRRLDRVPQLSKRFREAVLEAAVTGRLTGASTATWKRSVFGDLVANIRTGTTAVPTDENTGFPVLRSSSVRPLSVDMKDCRFAPKAESQKRDNFLDNGDLLFTRLSGSYEYVGNCALVTSVPAGGMQYPDRLFRARLKDPSLGPYIEIAFASRTVRSQVIARLKSSAGHQRISTDAITNVVVQIPPTDVRAEIVSRVSDLFVHADRIDQKIVTATDKVTNLVSSVLAKAFRGELVPQDPADEPVEKMLERIRAKRYRLERPFQQVRVPFGRLHRQKYPLNPTKRKGGVVMSKSRTDSDVKGKPYLAGILRENGSAASVEELFSRADLPIADFYKQLAWEVDAGHIKDRKSVLEAA